MASAIKHFLLVFDHKKSELIAEREFGRDAAAALKAYNEIETQYRDCDHIDIVLIGSDSIDTVKLTHANYFNGAASLAKYVDHFANL